MIWNSNNFITSLIIAISVLINLLQDVRCEKCQAPEIDQEKVEVLCLNLKKLSTGIIDNGDGTIKSATYFDYLEDSCSQSSEAIVIRCKIGYQNKKSKGEDAFLNLCKDGKWKYENTDSDDCESICGKLFEEKLKPTPKPLLYQGNEVDIKLAPWHVAIYRNSSNTFEQICGGTIIHSNVVISAAHCFYDTSYGELFDASHFWVGAGKRFRRYEADEPLAQFAHVKKIYLPLTFQSQPLRSDIAIVILDRHFKYNPVIAPVCLDWELGPDSRHSNLAATLYGWGDTKSTGAPSEKLLEINLIAMENAECKKMVDPNFRSDISKDKFCAINKSNATACGGDSGGGLITRRQGYKLTGVVSEGLNADSYCSNGFVTLFTRVRIFHDYIKTTVSENRNDEQNIKIQLYNFKDNFN
ncbi:chymotrypsinogen A-like [Condylostylus longicornis]|uniref:chymotrypsinogen A-like n=1 Tax=Condylostylus longicornis TaxID=2530218 RepID=UPI00244D9ED3|nr:chymotrypsinogen A-like [Condylostylus longicornis]